MRRLAITATLTLVLVLFAGGGPAFSQATFKIPFKFEAGGKTLPPGDYWIAQLEEGKITLRRQGGEEDISIPFMKKLVPPEQPIEEPQIVFDMVGNFEPSYTEYVTDYLLAEVWLTEKEGFLIMSTERSDYKKIVNGVKEKK